MHDQATLPTPHPLDGPRLRLYYGALDADMVSRISYLDVDLARPTIALAVAPAPVLDLGAAGHFDDNGVVPSTVVERGDELHLYYVGFQQQSKIPYTMLTGLAVSRDGGLTYSRLLTTPVLERSPAEPFFRTAPWLLPAGTGWRMWYVGGGGWVRDDERLLPTYSLLTMTSDDGWRWPSQGDPCFRPTGEEIGFGRPCVWRDRDRHRMWYSIRRRSGYRLGYAESSDGERWQRLDEVLDLGPPVTGFDDQMTCYPAIVKHGDDFLLFYNGNGYGRTGIGVAILEP